MGKRTLQRGVEEVRCDGDVAFQEGSLVGHNGPRELVSALILFGVWCSGGPQEREAEDISAARVTIFALGQNGDTVSKFTEVGVLRIMY